MERDGASPLLPPQARMGWGVWVERLAVNQESGGVEVNGEGWQDAGCRPGSPYCELSPPADG